MTPAETFGMMVGAFMLMLTIAVVLQKLAQKLLATRYGLVTGALITTIGLILTISGRPSPGSAFYFPLGAIIWIWLACGGTLPQLKRASIGLAIVLLISFWLVAIPVLLK